MKYIILTFFVLNLALAEETLSGRDKLVKEARRVEKGVLKDLGTLREKGCHLLKNKDCVPAEDSKKEESKDSKSN